jgi:hypothetical protein
VKRYNMVLNIDMAKSGCIDMFLLGWFSVYKSMEIC